MASPEAVVKDHAWTRSSRATRGLGEARKEGLVAGAGRLEDLGGGRNAVAEDLERTGRDRLGPVDEPDVAQRHAVGPALLQALGGVQVQERRRVGDDRTEVLARAAVDLGEVGDPLAGAQVDDDGRGVGGEGLGVLADPGEVPDVHGLGEHREHVGGRREAVEAPVRGGVEGRVVEVGRHDGGVVLEVTVLQPAIRRPREHALRRVGPLARLVDEDVDRVDGGAAGGGQEEQAEEGREAKHGASVDPPVRMGLGNR